MSRNLMTESQVRRVIEALQKLLETRGELLQDVELATFGPGAGTTGNYGALYLTKKGLEEVAGYRSYRDEVWGDPDSHEDPPRLVEISEDLVKRYDLSEARLQEVAAMLQ